MSWFTDNLGPFYVETPHGIHEVSYNTFDETMSLTLNTNGIDREKLLKQILGINTNKEEKKNV